MGERKGQNKYFPPDFDPVKHKSLDGYHGVHPLRERAKKLKSHGILVIRFEMPYNIWCGGCSSHIAMGVRYNAEKLKVGNYYTTPVYQFRMKCHLCDTYFEIKTDPANHDYIIVSGARRKEQRWDPIENGQIVPEEKATHKKIENDPMYRLEHGKIDASKKESLLPTLTKLELTRIQWKDDYSINRSLRDSFRTEKKGLKATADEDSALLEKASLDLTLLPKSDEDDRLASLLKYRSVESFEERQQTKRKEISNRPIFASKGTSIDKCSVSLPPKKGTALTVVKRKSRGEADSSGTFDSPPKIIRKGSLGVVRLSASAVSSSATPTSSVSPQMSAAVSGSKMEKTSGVASSSKMAETPAAVPRLEKVPVAVSSSTIEKLPVDRPNLGVLAGLAAYSDSSSDDNDVQGIDT